MLRRTVVLESGASFRGKIDSDGNFCGFGTLSFPDGSSLKGSWLNSEMHGKGVFESGDGFGFHGCWTHGVISGEVTEFFGVDTVFCGQYEEDVRHGDGILWLPSGSKVIGTWYEGELHGNNITFIYPDGETQLFGSWVNGVLRAAKCSLNGHEYTYANSTSTHICDNPLLEDPYEATVVYVKEASITGAGQGLFARTPISAGTVCSFYAGVRLSHTVVDRRPWSCNSNTLSLDDDVVIDVPPPFDSLKHYKASLGHKANHSMVNNAEYSRCWHPRFGEIKCIRTVRDIAKDEEITVDYSYTPGTGPKWYRMLNRS